MRVQSVESVDNKVLEDMELSDLNSESIHRYRIMFGNKKPGHVWTSLGDEEFMVKIGAARKGEDKLIHPTLAGLIFFGDFITITNELPDYFLITGSGYLQKSVGQIVLTLETDIGVAISLIFISGSLID